VATYREHGQALARGVPMRSLMAEMLGKREGCCRGRGGSMHLFDREHGASSAATPSSAAGCRWRPASRWPTSGCAPAR
jgi:TPP-dependent pyruvate/acetoin dehydrogenase alpha subunit